jgi:ribosomal protein S18 acetylase RimI-like enzyme
MHASGAFSVLSAARVMAVVVRKAHRGDLEALSSLNAEIQAVHAAALPFLFKEARPDMFVRAGLGDLFEWPDNLLFIADVDGTAAGYAYAQIVRGAETAFQQAHDMVYLHHIGVRTTCRRRGVGSALIEAVRAAADENGIATMALDVWMFNDAARAFFGRHGFVTCSARMWKPIV